MNRWQKWLDKATASASASQVAERMHVSTATVNRWKRGVTAPCAEVIRLAAEFGADPVEGQLAAGYLTEEMLMHGGLRGAVRHAPTAYLIEELHERYFSGRMDGDFPDLRKMMRS